MSLLFTFYFLLFTYYFLLFTILLNVITFFLNFILISCHLQVIGYEDRISLLYDYIISGFKYYSIKFINYYIMLGLIYYKNNSFMKVSVITNANEYYAMVHRDKNVFQKT